MAEIGGNWYDAWVAPGIVLAIIATLGAAIGWIRSYFAGKKSNVKEAKQLADETIQKAEEKGTKERADAKTLYTEKTEAAATLEEKRKSDAIDVKKDTESRMDDRFRFSDQEHAHQHAELKNELQALRTEVKRINKEVEELKVNNKPLKY